MRKYLDVVEIDNNGVPTRYQLREDILTALRPCVINNETRTHVARRLTDLLFTPQREWRVTSRAGRTNLLWILWEWRQYVRLRLVSAHHRPLRDKIRKSCGKLAFALLIRRVVDCREVVKSKTSSSTDLDGIRLSNKKQYLAKMSNQNCQLFKRCSVFLEMDSYTSYYVTNNIIVTYYAYNVYY